MSASTPLLSLKGITKIFPGVRALENVQLDLWPGKVTALIGENGAGKSTLVKVMTGIYQPEEGEILYKAIPIHLPTPESAHKVGITAIHQETVLFDELSVSENIFVGQYLYKGLLKTLDWPAMHRRANEILTRLEVQIDPRATLKTLSIAQRHMVAIARALAFDAQVVILDEPTAALSQHEILEFYHIVERLKQDGKAILFISHKFDEIFELADYYTILRDGVYVSSGAISDITEERMVSMMVGRAISQTYPKVDCTPGETVLEVTDLCHPTEFAHISFRLRKGEILGLLVWRLGIPAIVVTLGTMSIYRGIIFLLTDGGWVNSHQMSADFLSLPRSPLLGLPLLSWCAIAALLLVGYFLRYSRTGRALYTAGGNATAAYYTGINAGKMQFVSFCLSGALAGFCGYLWISRFAVAYVDVANGFELQVVAACVIGGISTMGGSGRVLGCLCGALFLGVINNALPVIGISPFWQMAISGAVIVMAVLLNERGNRGHGRLILRNAALARQKQAVKS